MDLAKFRVWRASQSHSKSIKMTKGDSQLSIIDFDNPNDQAQMTIETFLFLTKHGNALCVIDDYVIDLNQGNFIDIHPGMRKYPEEVSLLVATSDPNSTHFQRPSGGANVLKHCIGCDITDYFLGDEDLNGKKSIY